LEKVEVQTQTQAQHNKFKSYYMMQIINLIFLIFEMVKILNSSTIIRFYIILNGAIKTNLQLFWGIDPIANIKDIIVEYI
jgi:hypothetical protein